MTLGIEGRNFPRPVPIDPSKLNHCSDPSAWAIKSASDGSLTITIKSDLPTAQVASLLQQIDGSAVTFDCRRLLSADTLKLLTTRTGTVALVFYYLDEQSGNATIERLVDCFNDGFQPKKIGVNSSFVSDDGISVLTRAFEERRVPESIQHISLNHNRLTSVSTLPLARYCFNQGIKLSLTNNRIDADGADQLRPFNVAVIPWSEDRVD